MGRLMNKKQELRVLRRIKREERREKERERERGRDERVKNVFLSCLIINPSTCYLFIA